MSLKKRHHCYLFTIALLFALGGTGDLLSENVFLKDGSIIKGSIVKDAATTITVKKDDGKSEVISRDNILRILYTNLKMGKIHVQMRDGSNFEAFVVDEDQDTYTFRKELLSPDELKVNRSDILFISERNPSGLKGTPDTGSIDLSWFPPYNPVKHYLVYHREKSEGDFHPALKSRGKSLTLENLKSNTAYVVKVTAVDNSDEESSPSNVLAVSTKNIRPTPPGDIRYEKGETGADGTFTAYLRWQASIDPDGSVKGYRVFRKREGEYIKLAEPDTTAYSVTGLEPGLNILGVRAVDDLGDESDIARVSTSAYSLTVAGVFLLPMGRLSDLYKNGYGVTAVFTAENLLFDRFEPGIEAGYYRFTSAHYDVDGADRDVKEGYMVPALLRFGYGLGPFFGFSLGPYVAGGVSYNSVTYTNRFLVTVTKSALEPAFSAGVSVRYSPWVTWYLYGDCRITAIAEDSPLYLIALSLGAGTKF